MSNNCDNRESFPKEYYISIGFGVKSSDVHRSCSRVWYYYKVEKPITKFTEFRVFTWLNKMKSQFLLYCTIKQQILVMYYFQWTLYMSI